MVQGQTIQANNAATIGGTPIINSAGSIFVGNDAQPIPTSPPQAVQQAQPQPQNPAPVAVAGYTFTPVPQNNQSPPPNAVVVQGQTLQENGPVATIGGSPIAYSSGSIYVGNNAAPIPTSPPPQQQQNAAPVAVAGFTFTPVQQSNQGAPNAVIVQGQTLRENGPAVTVGGSALGFSSGSVYVGNSAVPIPTSPPPQQQQNVAPIAVAGYTFTPVQQGNQGASNAVVVQGQTLQENGPAVTIGGSALAFSSGSVYVGGNAAPVPTAPPQANQPNVAPVALSGYTFTPIQPGASSPSNAVVVQGQTLQENGPAVTVGGKALVYSAGSVYVGSSGAVVPTAPPRQGNMNPTVINGMTFTPVAQPNNQATPTPTPSPIVVAGMTASAGPYGEVIIGGQSVAPGAPQVTVAGVPVSLGSSGLIVGSSTIQLASIPTKAALATVAGQLITSAGSFGGIAIGGTTLTPGGSAVTISGTPVSLGGSGLVIGSNTIPLPAARNPVFTVGGSTFTAAAGGFALAPGTTLTPGGSVSIAGTVISLASSGGNIVIGSSTVALPSQSVFTVGGSTFTAAAGGFAIAPGTTLTPGGAATISGTVISLPASGGNLVIGSAIIPLPSQSVFTVGSQTFTANPTGFVVAPGTTLTPGGAATISGTMISLPSSGGNLIIGSSTIPLPPQSIFTIGSQTFTASAFGFAIAPGTTLLPGSSLTLSGTLLSLAPNGASLQIGSQTITLSRTPSTTRLPTLTINGQTITANPLGQYLLGNQTLIPGGSALTISGTVVSLASNQSVLVVGSRTQRLVNGTLVDATSVGTTTTAGLGGAIISGIGGGGESTGAAQGGQTSTAGGVRMGVGWGVGGEVGVVMVVVVVGWGWV